MPVYVCVYLLNSVYANVFSYMQNMSLCMLQYEQSF